MVVIYAFDAQVWIRSNHDKLWSRYFVTLPIDIAQQIRHNAQIRPCKGRWSIAVKARIGYVQRQTSIFPDRKSDSYLLPIKVQIRKELMIEAGMNLTIELIMLDMY